MTKFSSLFLGIFLYSSLVQAQSNFKPGMVVTSSGDTLKGVIDLREWLRNPAEVVFKTSPDASTEQNFTPANSRYFSVSDNIAYQSASVSLSSAPVEGRALPVGPDTTSTRATVFLQILASGPKLRLLSYTDDLKTRFYLQDLQSSIPPQELVYRKYYPNNQKNRLITDRAYQAQLREYAIQHQALSDELQSKIANAPYNQQDLIAIVSLLNGKQHQTTTSSSSKLSRTRFLAGIWLNRASIELTEGSKFGSNSKYTASYLPRLSMGFDIFANPTTQRLLLRTELSTTMAASKVTKEETPRGSVLQENNQYDFRQLSFSLNPQVLYHFYSTPGLKVYLAAGAMVTYAQYLDDRLTSIETLPPDQIVTNKTYEDYERPSTLFPSFTARAGVVASQKFDVSVLYTTAQISRKNYQLYTYSVNLGVTYLFNRVP